MGATYPNSIFNWVPRQDQVNIVFANDPNSLATEIQGIEVAIGPIPQIETNPPNGGSNVTYTTMSQRLSAAMNNAELPYVVLKNHAGFFIKAGQQLFNQYNQTADPYNIWNGSDLSIPCNGYWSIHADQKWNQQGNQFRGGNVLFLVLASNFIAQGNVPTVGGPQVQQVTLPSNAVYLDADIWDWSAQFANSQYHYASNVFGSNGFSKVKWEGLLHAGDRVQVLSANSTFCPGIQVTEMSLKAHCVRTITGTFKSG